MASIENRIAELAIPSLMDLGFELVRVQLGGGQSRPTLQIMAEPQDGSQMTVEGCALVSQQLSALLDVHDALPGAYVLEVSSPGIDRPLTRVKDFENWQGREAQIETHVRIQNRGRFRGIFKARKDGITLTQDGVAYDIDYNDIRKAKLVLTDELINETQKQQKQTAQGAA
ncbi:MAG TPA: ribosome maturation factor RimP [Alphaproteobacteria bacterium]|nr:ribosome maturation factor RimP [Alphaproteobacteria bacterium]